MQSSTKANYGGWSSYVIASRTILNIVMMILILSMMLLQEIEIGSFLNLEGSTVSNIYAPSSVSKMILCFFLLLISSFILYVFCIRVRSAIQLFWSLILFLSYFFCFLPSSSIEKNIIPQNIFKQIYDLLYRRFYMKNIKLQK